MTNKVLHLSIALLTLAPSLHAADGKEQQKRTFADAVKARGGNQGIAGILALSEKELTPPGSPVVTVQPTAQPETAQPQQSLEQVVRAADKSSATAAKALALVALASGELTAEETPAQPAPARSEAELPQIDQLLATADQNNPYVRWARLQQELAHINTQLQALKDPNAAQVEGTVQEAYLKKRREEVTREIDEALERLQLHTNKMSHRTLWNLANKLKLSLPVPAAVLTSEQRKAAQKARNAAIEKENKRLEEALKNTTPKIRKKTDIRWELFEPAEVLALRAQTIRPVEPTSAEIEELHNRQEEGRNFRLKNGQLLRPANYPKVLELSLAVVLAQKHVAKRKKLTKADQRLLGTLVNTAPEDALQTFQRDKDTICGHLVRETPALDIATGTDIYLALTNARNSSLRHRNELESTYKAALRELKECKPTDKDATEKAKNKLAQVESSLRGLNQRRDVLKAQIRQHEIQNKLPSTESWTDTLAKFTHWGKK